MNVLRNLFFVFCLLLGLEAACMDVLLAAQVHLDVDIIYASNDHTGRDPRIHSIGQDLPFDSLELLDRKQFSVDFKDISQIAIPNGGKMYIQPESYDGSMIKVKVWMEKASKYKLNMILQLANGGIVVVGGPSYQNGTILMPISAKIR